MESPTATPKRSAKFSATMAEPASGDVDRRSRATSGLVAVQAARSRLPSATVRSPTWARIIRKLFTRATPGMAASESPIERGSGRLVPGESPVPEPTRRSARTVFVTQTTIECLNEWIMVATHTTSERPS
jgi:hypothetical protein